MREDVGEVVGERGFRAHGPPGARMDESQETRVEHLTRRVEGRGGRAARPVDAVAQDRMAGRGEMDADLVRASGFERHGDEGRSCELLDGSVVRHRAPAALARPGDAPPPISAIVDEVLVECAGAGRMSFDDRQVLPLDRVPAEEVLEKGERLPVAGKEHRARALLVKAVDDSGEGAPAIAMVQVLEDAG